MYLLSTMDIPVFTWLFRVYVGDEKLPGYNEESIS